MFLPHSSRFYTLLGCIEIGQTALDGSLPRNVCSGLSLILVP
jgi:hypothetical protein